MSKEEPQIIAPLIQEDAPPKEIPPLEELQEFGYNEATLEDIHKISIFLRNGLLISELKTRDDGSRELWVYDLNHKKIYYYTDIPWQIDKILGDSGIEF